MWCKYLLGHAVEKTIGTIIIRIRKYPSIFFLLGKKVIIYRCLRIFIVVVLRCIDIIMPSFVKKNYYQLPIGLLQIWPYIRSHYFSSCLYLNSEICPNFNFDGIKISATICPLGGNKINHTYIRAKQITNKLLRQPGKKATLQNYHRLLLSHQDGFNSNI